VVAVRSNGSVTRKVLASVRKSERGESMSANVSRLIALGPGDGPGGVLQLTGGYMTLGRSHSNDLVIAEPTVSRVHASLTVQEDGRVSVQDLGSSAGTAVNGRPTTGPVTLQSDDVISFGKARFQYQAASRPSEATAALPVQRAPRQRQRDEHIQGQYDIENQHGGNISNVAGNQYTAYVSHIRQERESFLQAVAATKTKARWLIWIGAILSLIGAVIAAISFYQGVDNVPLPMIPDGPTVPALPAVPAFVRWYLIGLFIAAAGQIVLIIGVVLHVVATSRRKRVDREFPMPRPSGY
jgi:pSer/pThr/pTyr-binding forkhead associated (FHA) protein